jgi:Protein of unknown function (DUF2934)
MSKETVVNRATAAKPTATSYAGPGSEKTSSGEQAARRAEVHQGLVAQRAYELYEERGRQEGRALEDWLNAERQLLGRLIQGQA